MSTSNPDDESCKRVRRLIESAEESEGNMQESEEIADHFSALPECIIHHILSLLPAKAVVFTSTLSKTLQQCSRSFPYFECHWNSNAKKYLNSSLPLIQRSNNFLNQVEFSLQRCVQQLSNSSTHLHRFRMRIYDLDIGMLAPRMDHWLDIAVEHNVAEIDLDVSNRLYNVPQSVLLAKTLTTLTLSYCTLEGELDIKLPKLRVLDCSNVEFRKGVQIFENLAASCPSIEHLELKYCQGLYRIRSNSSLPQLKHVQVSNCRWMNTVDIVSPNLLTFEFTQLVLSHRRPLRDCEVNLLASVALKELTLRNVPISALLQKLISERFGGTLEVLKLYHCESSKAINIPIQHLKELLLVGCRDFINIPHNLTSSCIWSLLKVHIKFPYKGCVPWSKWKDFLMKLSVSANIKLVVYSSYIVENIIIHEHLSGVSVSSLHQLQDAGFNILISSWSYSDILDDVFCMRLSKTLSVVCSTRISTEWLSEILMKSQCHPEWNYFGGFETLDPSQITEDHINLAFKSFLEKHSTGGYNTTTFVFKW